MAQPSIALARQHNLEETEPSWVQCLTVLQALAGLPQGIDTHRYLRPIVSGDEQLVKYILGIMYVESRFRTGAVSPRGAYGLMQVTDIAVRDSAPECGLPAIQNMNQLLVGQTNVRYGVCYLTKLYKQFNGDWIRILIAYNSGYQGLTQYEKGSNVPSETANYVLQIHRVLNECSK